MRKTWNLSRSNKKSICSVLRMLSVFCFVFLPSIPVTYGQHSTIPHTDVNTPLHMLQPDYDIPYDVPKREDIKEVLDKIYDYLDSVTPAKMVDRETGKELTDLSKLNENSTFMTGDFRLNSYES